MDVEWCLGGGEVYVLQARPVTSLPAGGGPPRSFDNSNIQESYNGVTTPLTFSFASRAYATVFRSMLQALGVPRRSVAEFEPAARTLLALIRGRVYYNLASWQHMLSLFPGGRRRTEEVATVMWHTELAAPTAERGTLRRRAETAAVAARLVLHFVRLRREIERFLAHFDATYAGVDRARLADASLTELYATSHRLYAGLLDHWDAPNINDLRVTVTCGRLRRLLERLYEEGEVDARLADLLGGIDGIESVAPTQLLVSVAEAARRDEAAAAALRSGDAVDALDRLRERAPVIADRVDRYMDLYGDRGIGELKLETTPPRDDPSFVVEVLRGYLDRPDLRAGDLVASERDRFRAAAADLARRMPPWRRPLLRRELALARTAVKARETMRLRRTRAFALARDVYRGMGRRLHEAGVLEDPRDVLYLTVDELEGFVEGRAVSAELVPLVAARRAEYARYESEEAPNRLEAAGSPYLGIGGPQPSARDAANGHGAGRTLRGLGCCAGVVDGSVRILTDARDGLALNGRILCTVRTDPGWAPLFPMVSGLIVERGSALSHSAVVARELGIPTVVGVPDVTRILEEGETVRLDGAAGTVDRLG